MLLVSEIILIDWLREICSEHKLEPYAVFRKRGTHPWPFTARTGEELATRLNEGGHLLPLPTEPAALANVIEVSLLAFVIERIAALPDASARQGTERGYPDLEISGSCFGSGYHAVDVKVARRSRSGLRTQSAITLYTGNTYFRHPDLDWPGGILRPFSEYRSHIDLIAIYTFDTSSISRIADLELIVHEPWRIASRQRSSTTREYIGAVRSIADLRAGRGEFASREDFYAYWRKYAFKVGRVVEQRLQKEVAARRR
jgi:hypothetical protein